MIDSNRIVELFGVDNPPPDNLLQAIFDFTMGFYYAEQRLFERSASLNRTDEYADNLIRLTQENPVNSDRTFDFFKQRYTNELNGPEALESLADYQYVARIAIYEKLIIDEPTDAQKVSACLKVIIRLRHNLFHGNKGRAIEIDPQGQSLLIRRAVQYLSEWLTRIPPR